MTTPLPPRVELCIDALVLDGVTPGPGLAAAVEAELYRLLATEGALDALTALGSQQPLHIARLQGGSLGQNAGANLGAGLGQAVFRSLQGLSGTGAAAATAASTMQTPHQQEKRS